MRPQQAEELRLEEELDVAKQQYLKTGSDEATLSALQREVSTNQKLYQLFSQRIDESAAGNFGALPVKVISPAVIPTQPSRPNKVLVIDAAFVIALLIGVVVVLINEMMNHTIRSAANVEEALHVPLLGVLPKLKKRDGPKASLSHAFFDADDPDFKEGIGTIRTPISQTSG